MDIIKVKVSKTKEPKKNGTLTAAKSAKNDEFYTQLTDIEKEMKHYTAHFKDKVIYCNCDDARQSKFFHYFSYKFEQLGLKKLIAVAYKEGGKGIYSEYNGDKNCNGRPDEIEIDVKEMEGNGDFRSAECIQILMNADIVITNPPFSLFREYVKQLADHNKEFLIIGNMNAITYKECFKLIKDHKLWMGVSPRSMDFVLPDGSISTVNACWFTNLTHSKRNDKLILYKNYTPEEYPMYDNYDAINVDKVKDIPMDYYKVIGVPITFLGNHNPEQFEIVNMSTMSGVSANYWTFINKRPKYARIFIKNKQLLTI